ncbi:hypothetical protein RWE15_08500 [Virgibacillus halophilus]|uniref:DUF1269 domain-containing protein n=1 Tax=Tigheibacillus halophilus TaxID=361280 RepID=A0ABU5C7C2_9BACI|nr:hypothetical protein [Virgibacillus halophilus]
MYVLATFDHSIYVELALSALEKRNIPKENILAVPLDNASTSKKLFDTIHRSDGASLFDIAAALATAFSVIGASVGFRLAWGPIIWGIIGAVAGFIIGFTIDLLKTKRKQRRQRKTKGKITELIVIIYCEHEQTEMVERICWDNLAFGVAKLDREL